MRRPGTKGARLDPSNDFGSGLAGTAGVFTELTRLSSGGRFSVITAIKLACQDLAGSASSSPQEREVRSSRHHTSVLRAGGSEMFRSRQRLLLSAAFLCLALLGGMVGWALFGRSSEPTAVGPVADTQSASSDGGGTPSGSASTGGGGNPSRSAPTGGGGSPSGPSTLPTYDPSTVPPTTKPPPPTDDDVISLGNIGSPTVDSQHPNMSAGHMLPWSGLSSSPHCILIFNRSLPQALTIVSVSFHVDLAGSGDAGPLQFAVDNTDPNCGWIHYADPTGLAPTCGGKTLLPLTRPSDPNLGPGCVLRLNFPAPDSNVDRTGHFNFIFETQCVDRTVAPCDLLTEQPTVAHPVTVRWSPDPFYVAACGRDAPRETEADAAKGTCVNWSPSASTSASSPAASSSAALSPSS